MEGKRTKERKGSDGTKAVRRQGGKKEGERTKNKDTEKTKKKTKKQRIKQPKKESGIQKTRKAKDLK